jgi:hypothetical protein
MFIVTYLHKLTFFLLVCYCTLILFRSKRFLAVENVFFFKKQNTISFVNHSKYIFYWLYPATGCYGSVNFFFIHNRV